MLYLTAPVVFSVSGWAAQHQSLLSISDSTETLARPVYVLLSGPNNHPFTGCFASALSLFPSLMQNNVFFTTLSLFPSTQFLSLNVNTARIQLLCCLHMALFVPITSIMGRNCVQQCVKAFLFTMKKFFLLGEKY